MQGGSPSRNSLFMIAMTSHCKGRAQYPPVHEAEACHAALALNHYGHCQLVGNLVPKTLLCQT